MAVAPDLGALIALAFLTMLILILAAYQATVGRVVVWLIAELDRAVINIPHVTRVRVFGFLIDPLNAFQNLVYKTLGTLIEADKAVWARFVSWNAYAWSKLSEAVAEVGHGTERAIDTLRHAAIPALLGAGLAPFRGQISWLIGQVKALTLGAAHAIEHPGRTVVKTIERVRTIEHTTVRIVTRTVPAAVAKAVAVPIPRLGQLEREAAAAKKRLGQVARTLTPAGIIGLVGAAVFSQFGLGWLKCSNVRKAGKSVCGMNAHVLEGLLAGVVSLFATFSLVEFAKYLQPVVGEIGSEVTGFWRAEIAGQSRDRELGSPSLTAL